MLYLNKKKKQLRKIRNKMDKKKISEKMEELLKKEKKKGKFKQSIEMIVNFKHGVDLETKDKLNLIVQLPKSRGKETEIGVFADGDLNLKAKKFSNYVFDRHEIEEYSRDKRKIRKIASKCYWFLSQPELLPVVGKFWGVVLGTRGKMPQPLPSNVDLEQIISKYKNSVRIKSKKGLAVHVPIGTEDMSADDLLENFNTVLIAIERQIPEDKISSIYIKRTMSEPVRVL